MFVLGHLNVSSPSLRYWLKFSSFVFSRRSTGKYLPTFIGATKRGNALQQVSHRGPWKGVARLDLLDAPGRTSYALWWITVTVSRPIETSAICTAVPRHCSDSSKGFVDWKSFPTRREYPEYQPRRTQ